MEPYPDEVTNGVRIVRFFPRNFYWTFNRSPRHPLKKALWHVRDAWNHAASLRLRELLKKDPPDVLHTHVIDGLSASIWRAAKKMGAGVIHTAHDYHLICPRAFMMTKDWKLCTSPSLACRIYGRWHVNTTRYVDVFASPSRFLIEQHVKGGLRAKSTVVVANGIPIPELPSRLAEQGAEYTRPIRLLLAARMTVEKGIRVVLDAMTHLPRDLPVTLDVAGRGALADDVVRAAAMDPRITFHGYVSGEQKHQLFSRSDCLLLPSLWYENAPVVIVEAGAYGMGVIASDIGAIPEFVSHERNGLLFKMGDPVDLARAVTRIARNRTLLTTFAKAGRDFAGRSSVGAMADHYLEHYCQLAAASRKAA
jgi:glycosyltransferase involved in cell wall biosynthesis